jgi:hypothetical protein
VSLFQSHVFKHEFFLFPVASEFPLNFSISIIKITVYVNNQDNHPHSL